MQSVKDSPGSCVHFVSLVWLCIMFVQMCGSVLASLIGMAGSCYCFIISVMAMLEGPSCFDNTTWSTPFMNDGAKYENTIDRFYVNVMLDWIQLLNIVVYFFFLPLILRYLFDHKSWSQCTRPAHIVEWNVTLLSILLGLSLIEFLICFVQFISGLVSAICRPCCYKQQYSLTAWTHIQRTLTSNDRLLFKKKKAFW